jgi:hypothetical protein
MVMLRGRDEVENRAPLKSHAGGLSIAPGMHVTMEDDRTYISSTNNLIASIYDLVQVMFEEVRCF